jgi:hypothetical protein
MEGNMNGAGRFFIGVLGGLAASTSKVLALDVERLGHLVETGNFENMSDLLGTIYIVTPILMFLGGLVAWASAENHRMKLLAIGCAAPAMIAPWTTVKAEPLQIGFMPEMVTSAYAQTQVETKQTGTYVKGLRALFGLERPGDNRYWVVVGSRKDLGEARKYASEINAIDPSMKAFVGEKRPGNDMYPIIVGGPEAFYPLDKANQLKDRAMKISIVPEDAHLSNYVTPLPRPQAR